MLSCHPRSDRIEEVFVSLYRVKWINLIMSSAQGVRRIWDAHCTAFPMVFFLPWTVLAIDLRSKVFTLLPNPLAPPISTTTQSILNICIVHHLSITPPSDSSINHLSHQRHDDLSERIEILIQTLRWPALAMDKSRLICTQSWVHVTCSNNNEEKACDYWLVKQ